MKSRAGGFATEYRKLGGSGLRVSEVGLGSGNFGWFCDEAQSLQVIRRASISA
ncbi:MAG: hypothetical protein HYX94_06045 [Chloroflexi bacterium]|nr:hypothetical protein [Chloroflexota bacterium]